MSRQRVSGDRLTQVKEEWARPGKGAAQGDMESVGHPATSARQNTEGALDEPLPAALVRKLVKCSLAQMQARATQKRNKASS